MQTAFFCNNPDTIRRVYGDKPIEGMYPTVIGESNIEEHLPQLKGMEAAFSTWGFPQLTDAQLDALPNWKILFYGAGTVKAFAQPLLERGIRVVSAAHANGVFVAEYTLAQILLAQKGYFRTVRVADGMEKRRINAQIPPFGNYDSRIGLIGAGHIGRMVIDLLLHHRAKIMVYDPYLTEEGAQALGVQKATLEEIFASCEIVSNHAPNIPETVGMLTYDLFSRMQKGATFINTGRGATVNEPDMIRFLSERGDVCALLDVTWPEPPVAGSPLYTLPNVFLTPHIAGSIGREVMLMGELCLDEFARYKKGEPWLYEVTLEQLARLA